MTTSNTTTSSVTSLVVRSIHLMAHGSPAEFDEVIHPAGFTREQRAAPPSARGTGPAAFHALALWLRDAFSDLSYEIHHAITEGDMVTVNSTMSGRHTGPLVFYTPEGAVDTAFAPTRRTFAITQSHWLVMDDGRIGEHWANRDDLGMARQLGWVPPSPGHLYRSARLKRRAIRELR
jgi:predicted ester cyclase